MREDKAKTKPSLLLIIQKGKKGFNGEGTKVSLRRYKGRGGYSIERRGA